MKGWQSCASIIDCQVYYVLFAFMEVQRVSSDSAFVVFLFLCFVFQIWTGRIKDCRVKPEKRSIVREEDGRCAGKAQLRKGELRGEVFGLVGAQVVLGFQLRDAMGWGERGEQVGEREEVTAKSVHGIIGEQIGFDKFVEVEVMQSFKEKRANTGIPWDNKGNRQGGGRETGSGQDSQACAVCTPWHWVRTGSLALPTDGGMAQRLPGAIMEEAQLAMFLTVQLTSQLLHDSSLGLEINLICCVVEAQGQIACCYLSHDALSRSYHFSFSYLFQLQLFWNRQKCISSPNSD